MNEKRQNSVLKPKKIMSEIEHKKMPYCVLTPKSIYMIAIVYTNHLLEVSGNCMSGVVIL